MSTYVTQVQLYYYIDGNIISKVIRAMRVIIQCSSIPTIFISQSKTPLGMAVEQSLHYCQSESKMPVWNMASFWAV